MAKSREQKKEIVKKLTQCFTKAKSVVFSRFNALTVHENEELRKNLKSENNEYIVVKKTLLNLAANGLPAMKDVKVKDFQGKISAVFSYSDEISSSKIMYKFRKSREEKIEFLGGIFEGKFITAKKIEELAELPSKLELYAKIAGSLNAPLSGFVNALAGNLRNLVYVLNAVKNNKY